MTGFVIERCTDAAVLVRLRAEVLRCVFSIAADADTEELESENLRYYERHLADGSHVACLALSGGGIAGCGGMCVFDEMPSPDNPSGRCAYLMNVYVREPFRGKGAGRDIVNWLVGQARRRGITKIFLETTRQARRLYREAGFDDMEDMMKWNPERQTSK